MSNQDWRVDAMCERDVGSYADSFASFFFFKSRINFGKVG